MSVQIHLWGTKTGGRIFTFLYEKITSDYLKQKNSWRNVPRTFTIIRWKSAKISISEQESLGKMSKSTCGEKSHSLSLTKETQEAFCIWEKLCGETTPTLGDPHGNQLLTTCSVSCPSSAPTQQRSREGQKGIKTESVQMVGKNVQRRQSTIHWNLLHC